VKTGIIVKTVQNLMEKDNWVDRDVEMSVYENESEGSRLQ
jgi:hypothetical protein